MQSAHYIELGKHEDNIIFSSWPHLRQRVFKKSVCFNQDCAYDIGAYHQTDINKLFGAAFGFRGAHWNSSRFGWYYDVNTAEIVLVAYCYDRGVRNWNARMVFPEVARVKLGETVDCCIEVTKSGYIFHVTKGDLTIGQRVFVPHSGVLLFGYTLSLYWGGDTKCPHLLHVWLD